MAVLLTLVCLSVAAAIAWPLSRNAGRQTGWILGLLYLVAAALFTPAAVPVLTGREDPNQTHYAVQWIESLGIQFAFVTDGVGVLFTYIALLIGAVVLFYATSYMTKTENHTSFYLVMTLFTLSMVALVLTADLVVLFIAWELTSLASFLLIARSGRDGEAASMRTLLVTFIGGLTLLAAVVMMAVNAGTTNISAVMAHQMWTDQSFTTAVAILIILSAASKSAQFPFHGWLPDAMAAATPVSAYLHAAAVVKAGIFLLMRFSPIFAQNTTWNLVLVFLGLGTSILGGWFALAQPDAKKLMAYSTVSQLGLIVAAIGTGSEIGMTAAVIHTIAHALFKSGLFMMVGVVDHATGTRIISKTPQLYKALPISFILTLLGTAAMAGIPPLFGFLSKETILTAVLNHPQGAAVGVTALLLAGISGVLTFSYSAKVLFGIFIFGKPSQQLNKVPSTLVIMPALVILASAALIFVLPLVEKFSAPAVSAGLAVVVTPELSLWHGVNAELITSASIIVIGIMLLSTYKKLWPWVEAQGQRVSSAQIIETTTNVLVALATGMHRITNSVHAAIHVGPMLASFALIMLFGGSWLSATGVLPPLTAGMNRPIDVIVLLLMLAAVTVLIVARSRLVATLALSTVGVSAVIQIVGLGAPDVALTQLLVESLTIIVIMLVLFKLPLIFEKQQKFHVPKFLFALGVGVSVGIGAWALLGRRERSELAEYYLANTKEISGGDNPVNVILVEFRALDTMGELIVLGMAGIAIIAILASLKKSVIDPLGKDDPGLEPLPEISLRAVGSTAERSMNVAWGNAVQLQLMLKVIVPVLFLVSAMIFWRGHNEPGGGFIAALVGAAAVGMMFLSTSSARRIGPENLPVYLIGSGVAIAVATGIWNLLATGSFLQPMSTTLLGVSLSTALLFDLGVYLAVLGLMVVAFNFLGTGQSPQGMGQSDGGGSGKISARTTFIADGEKPQEVGK